MTYRAADELTARIDVSACAHPSHQFVTRSAWLIILRDVFLHSIRLLKLSNLLLILLLQTTLHAAQPLNVLLITVDDMNCDSVGVFGSVVRDITPNIDRLAAEGLRFENGHVTIAICQPTRAVWMTGRYPHNNGALGFDRITPGVPTLPEKLKESGYYNGLMAKQTHVIPSRAQAFHQIVPARELQNGRSPQLYYQRASAFFRAAKNEGKPFFLMANVQDPHRPFAGSAQERRGGDRPTANPQRNRELPVGTRPYQPGEIIVPGFLPDLPEIRTELAQYFTSVHRADASVGAILRALEESGLRDSTIVIFLSDHGMPLPFAKTNVWRHSTRTPWIMRWPGVIRPGSTDRRHFVSGIDLAPTLLDVCGLEPLEGMDGRSFLPLLHGQDQKDRAQVFTQINTIASKRSYPMRAIQDERYGYIFNAWSDGKTVFQNESQSGLTFKAMKAAAVNDPSIAARVRHFLYRTPDEFYDYEQDPDALHNLVEDPQHAAIIAEYRNRLRNVMETSHDPQLGAYREFLKANRE